MSCCPSDAALHGLISIASFSKICIFDNAIKTVAVQGECVIKYNIQREYLQCIRVTTCVQCPHCTNIASLNESAVVVRQPIKLIENLDEESLRDMSEHAGFPDCNLRPRQVYGSFFFLKCFITYTFKVFTKSQVY